MARPIEKVFYTIGEVSRLCEVPAHVLRYWEKEFPQLTPSTRRGRRRYYQKKDIAQIERIRTLLYEEGFTISGARSQLDKQASDQAKLKQLDAGTLKEFMTTLTEIKALLVSD